MTFEDFARNLRGVNGTVDFDPEYLVSSFGLQRPDLELMQLLPARYLRQHPETGDYHAARALRPSRV